jgi:hypothetical protein
VWKLWSGVFICGKFGKALRCAGTLAGAPTESQAALSRGGIVVIEQCRRERLAHLPLDIVGEHAQQDVGAHLLFEAMVSREDFEVD